MTDAFNTEDWQNLAKITDMLGIPAPGSRWRKQAVEYDNLGDLGVKEVLYLRKSEAALKKLLKAVRQNKAAHTAAVKEAIEAADEALKMTVIWPGQSGRGVRA
jgi:hypothetical protein